MVAPWIKCWRRLGGFQSRSWAKLALRWVGRAGQCHMQGRREYSQVFQCAFSFFSSSVYVVAVGTGMSNTFWAVCLELLLLDQLVLLDESWINTSLFSSIAFSSALCSRSVDRALWTQLPGRGWVCFSFFLSEMEGKMKTQCWLAVIAFWGFSSTACIWNSRADKAFNSLFCFLN